MNVDTIIGWVLGLVTFVSGYFVGWNAARGSLQEKVKDIIKVKQKIEGGGGVHPLTPQELNKKRGRELLDKYM